MRRPSREESTSARGPAPSDTEITTRIIIVDVVTQTRVDEAWEFSQTGANELIHSQSEAKHPLET